MKISSGSRIGSYEIIALLGAGGMGEVYRAYDTKLDRNVAIKVLPADLSADPASVVRFEREAKAVAALSHPNILSIFDFGIHDGVSYAVMELLEGETLRLRLDAGPIVEKQAIDYGLQIARGLSAAHEKGIVHRDLKPENLFIQKDGCLKILDFGLAKRGTPADQGEEASAPTVSFYTEPGTVMGTAGYMSPEQVRGLPVDPRSDIFAFGAILYEMLSGVRAFKRETAADTLAAIIKEEPPELSKSGRHITPALENIVKHCLEKERERRYQAAHDIALALGQLSSSGGGQPAMVGKLERRRNKRLWFVAAACMLFAIAALTLFLEQRYAGTSRDRSPAKPKRLAVLPFENLGDTQDAYFAAGMTEEVINRLANLQGLAVISRTTVMGYNRQGKTLRQIGLDLGVDFVLEGTIRWERGAGKRSRVWITPALVQVADDTQLWSSRYNRVMADIFIIQSEVAENVVRALGMKLMPRERAALAAASTSNIEAQDFYFRGLVLAGQSQNSRDQESAVRMFQSAVDLDPGFTQALSQLVKAHLSLYFYIDRLKTPPDRSHADSARELLNRLSKIGEDLPEICTARGYYSYWALEKIEPALREFKAALALQPNNTQALAGELFMLRRLGRWDEAAEINQQLSELDPQNPETLFQCGMTCVAMRRYAEAERFYALATTFNRQYGIAWGQRTLLQTLRGNLRNAERIITEARMVEGFVDDLGAFDFATFRVPLLKRDFPEALRQVDMLKRNGINMQWFFLPSELMRAQAYAASGAPDKAHIWYEAARRKLENLLANSPKDSRYHGALAIAYAGLGLKAQALREAKMGVELMPVSTDAWKAMWRLQELARVHAMLGNQNEAIETLNNLLSRPCELSTHLLRLDPCYDSLRSNPEFQALLLKFGNR